MTRAVARDQAPSWPALRRLRRFFRSPKGYLLLALVPLAAIGAAVTGGAAALSVVVAAVLTAAILEFACVALSSGSLAFPSSALLSGLIVAMVLSAQEPWYVAAAAGALATCSKHLIRAGRSHIFNPAAFGLLGVYLLFSSGHSWWGGLPDLPAPFAILVLLAGVLVAERANKLPAALAFLGMYVALFTGAALNGHAAFVADLFRPPFLNMALFFGLFMITDPPTSPVPFRPQAVFGAAAAALSFGAYMETRSLAYLLVALLVANAGYAAWQYVIAARRSRAAAPRAQALSLERHIAGIALPAATVVLVALLALGLAIVHRTSGAAAGAAALPTGGQPQQAARGQAGSRVPLAFHDQFVGTVAQQQDQTGAGTIEITGTGSGERAVQLRMGLVLGQASAGRRRVQGGQATLADSSGAPLCQGQVVSFDGQALLVSCRGTGADSGTQYELNISLTSASNTSLQGALEVAPVQ